MDQCVSGREDGGDFKGLLVILELPSLPLPSTLAVHSQGCEFTPGVDEHHMSQREDVTVKCNFKETALG